AVARAPLSRHGPGQPGTAGAAGAGARDRYGTVGAGNDDGGWDPPRVAAAVRAPGGTHGGAPGDQRPRVRRSASRLSRTVRRLDFAGLVTATAALGASLTPSLIPRHWTFQAVVTGIVAAAAYGVGCLG